MSKVRARVNLKRLATKKKRRQIRVAAARRRSYEPDIFTQAKEIYDALGDLATSSERKDMPGSGQGREYLIIARADLYQLVSRAVIVAKKSLASQGKIY